MSRTISLLVLLSFSDGVVAQRLLPVGEGILGGTGVNDAVVYNGKLVLGGFFNSFNGQNRRAIIGWDGGTVYDTMPGAFVGLGPQVNCLELYQGDLIAAGRNFSPLDSVLRWNGSQWQAVGTPFNDAILDLAILNGDLIACGNFTENNGVPMNHVSRWDGASWQAMDNGLGGNVRGMSVYAGNLYAGGDFSTELGGGTPALALARWNGATWEQVHTGVDGYVRDLYSDSGGLSAVGTFTASGTGQPLSYGAKYDGNAFTDLALPGSCSAIMGDTPFGPIYTTAQGTFIPSCGPDAVYQWDLARAYVSYQGMGYLVGTFIYHSYRDVRGVGRLVEGSDVTWLDVAGIRARISPGGAFFYNNQGGGGPGFEVPAGSGTHSVFSMGFCAAGVANGSLSTSLWSYHTSSWHAGPTALDTTDAYYDRYYQTWPMDQGRVWDHAANWNVPGYATPYAIARWPGNGDPLNGEPDRVAPFQDHDVDGFYDPQDGEVPLIHGGSSVLTLLSDHQDTSWAAPPVDLDVMIQTYGYHTQSGDTLHHVLFLSNKFINRSGLEYDTLFLAANVDYDLGCTDDDYVGCDTILDMGYVYNGDAVDEDCNGLQGYNALPPAQGLVALNAHMNAFVAYNNSTGVLGDVFTPEGMLNYMHGKCLDGSPIIRCPFTDTTRYMYPDDPWLPQGSHEVACGYAPYDRRVLVSYGPYLDIAPGDTICLDLALVFAAGNGDNLLSVQELEQRATAVRAWYDQHMNGCSQPVALSAPTASGASSLEFTVYPVPTGDRLHLRTSGGMRVASTEVLTLDGRSLGRSNLLGAEGVSVAHLAPGIYHLAAYTMEGDRLVRSFVKE